MLDDEGKCSALLTRKGFFDFVICRTNCNMSHSVGVVCQHDQKTNSEFSNNMSDIKVSMTNRYNSLQVLSSCKVGWFMVNDMCIYIYSCLSIKSFEQGHSCTNTTVTQELCIKYGSHLAHRVLNNVTVTKPGNILNTNTKLSLFWDMFHHIGDINHLNMVSGFHKAWQLSPHKTYLAVNGSGLCGHFNMDDHCIDNYIALTVHYYAAIYYGNKITLTNHQNHLYSITWSLIHDIYFQMSTSTHFTLCEKFTDHSEILNKCSEFYMICNDGTCVHDSLVCDGYPHCPRGEDEAGCQHICSNHTNNCVHHCHRNDLCSCSSEYFQCLSGGCVPLQKLCDKIPQCLDASDEPPTCVYHRPEQSRCPFISLDINNYLKKTHKTECGY